MPVIDVHTHNYTRGWLDLLRTHGGQYGLKMRPDGQRGDLPRRHAGRAPAARPFRLRPADPHMDAAGIDCRSSR